jgi:hypothetical protein
MIKISVQAADLLQAISSVGIVTPRSGGTDSGAGYHIRVQDNGDCSIYSRDDTKVTRANLPLQGNTGTGAFVLPLDMVKSLTFVDGLLSFEADVTAPWKVSFVSEKGATIDQSSINPTLINDCESELEDVTGDPVEFPAAILRSAIQIGQDYTDKAGSTDCWKTYKIWDGTDEDPRNQRGNGVLFCSDERRAFYFQCKAFVDRGLILHNRNQPAVMAFLAQAGRTVQLSKSDSHYFMESDGRLLGWVRDTVSHNKFTYYPLDKDQWVLKFPKDIMIKALKYMEASTPERFRWEYDHKTKTLKFLGSNDAKKIESFPVPCQVEGEAFNEDFGFNANVGHSLELFDTLKGHEATLRVRLDKGSFIARTIEEFHLDPNNGKVLIQEQEDSVGCRVTRVLPSRT